VSFVEMSVLDDVNFRVNHYSDRNRIPLSIGKELMNLADLERVTAKIMLS